MALTRLHKGHLLTAREREQESRGWPSMASAGSTGHQVTPVFPDRHHVWEWPQSPTSINTGVTNSNEASWQTESVNTKDQSAQMCPQLRAWLRISFSFSLLPAGALLPSHQQLPALGRELPNKHLGHWPFLDQQFSKEGSRVPREREEPPPPFRQLNTCTDLDFLHIFQPKQFVTIKCRSRSEKPAVFY